MHPIQYLFAILIGLIMGLIGGGGSILTLPVLVYGSGIDTVLATGYSLFIVGISAAAGAYLSYRKSQIDLGIAIKFAVPSFIAVYLTRRYIIPWLPDPLFTSETMSLTKGTGLMLLFVLIMIAAAVAMLRPRKKETTTVRRDPALWKVMLEGSVVGVLTGLVGAGGGFLIVPALVLFTGLPMKTAIGTSLFIIAVKSLIGFTGDLHSGQNIDWVFLLVFSGLAIVGIVIGSRLSRRLSPGLLKRGFAYFVLLMAIAIAYVELS